MEYKFCMDDNFEDLASGRVLYGNCGLPNFPVRLGNEIFRRCLQYTEKKEDVTVYDPCCGGGYFLTVLGFCNEGVIGKVIGSDIDEQMLAHARRNVSLLSKEGLENRKKELVDLYGRYQKQSHKEALDSLARLEEKVCTSPATLIFQSDCTKKIKERITPDIIITDVPYGNLVEWKGQEEHPIEPMLEQLSLISHVDTVLCIIMDKKCKISTNEWKRVEKQNIGKRKFEIFKRV